MNGTVRSLCVLVALLPFAVASRASSANLLLSTADDQPLAVEKYDCDPADDWFGTLTITVRNTSAKPVAYAEFTVYLSDARVDGEPMTLRLYYGERKTAEAGKVGPDVKLLEPSKTVKLKVASDKPGAVAAQRKSMHMPYRGGAVLELRSVAFADGSRWGDGAASH